MKYLLFLLIFAVSCTDDTVPTKGSGDYWAGQEIKVVEFEGCEYVKFGGGDVIWGAHKGNCRNEIHKQ